MPTETALTRSIIKMLERIPESFVMKIWGSAYAKGGIPDIMFIVRGVTFFFEVKVGRNKPTKLQLHRMDKLRCAGAEVFVVRSVAEVETAVTLYLPAKTINAAGGTPGVCDSRKAAE